METYSTLNLKTYVNNRGCTTQYDYKLGLLSLGGSSLPAEEFPFDKPFLVDDIPFVFSQTEMYDNMECTGQTILFPAQVVKRLHVLGVSNNGDLFDNIYFLFKDSVVFQSRLYLSDFMSPKPAFANRAVLSFSYMQSKIGRYDHIRPNLWYFCIALPQSQVVEGLSFEDNPSMHVFALTLEIEKETTIL